MQLRHRLPVPARRDDFKGDPETVSSNMASWQNSWEKSRKMEVFTIWTGQSST
jgi:hypothetical protein